jgi:hypothetical protein
MPALNRGWKIGRHGPLETLDLGLFTVTGEIAMPLGRFPRRMTVATLAGGGTLVWSPVAVDDETLAGIEALGPPRFLVVPGPHHRLDVAAWKARFPDARVVCPPGAAGAVAEAAPVDHTDDPFDDPQISFSAVQGTGRREAALIVTREGRSTLVLNDILANVRYPKGIGAHVMARLFGFGVRRPRIPRPVRKRLVESEKLLGAAFARWSNMADLERIVVSHGEVIRRHPRRVCRRVGKELIDA